MKSLHDVRTKWYSLGKQLGIHTSSLDVILRDHPRDVATCLRTMLLNRLRAGLTWKQIIIALKSNTLRENTLAERLSRQYLSAMHGMHVLYNMNYFETSFNETNVCLTFRLLCSNLHQKQVYTQSLV